MRALASGRQRGARKRESYNLLKRAGWASKANGCEVQKTAMQFAHELRVRTPTC